MAAQAGVEGAFGRDEGRGRGEVEGRTALPLEGRAGEQGRFAIDGLKEGEGADHAWTFGVEAVNEISTGAIQPQDSIFADR
jgi:hypothetical protein